MLIKNRKSANKANESVYARNLDSSKTMNSLKADIAEAKWNMALVNFETTANCWDSLSMRGLFISRFKISPIFGQQ